MKISGFYSSLILVDWLVVSYASVTGFYADDSLRQTIPIPKLRHKQKDEMREEILTVLGLDHVPQPLPRTYGKKRAPQFMIDLYNKLQNDEAVVGDGQIDSNQLTMSNSTEDPIHVINNADMIVSFHNHADNRNQKRHDKERKLYFDFRDVAPEEMMTGAELRLYKAPTEKKRFTSEFFNIEIYRGLHVGDHGKPPLQLEDSVVVNGSFEGWLVLNVSQAGMHWQIFPYDNLGLTLIVTDMNGKEINPRHLEICGMNGPQSKRPFMLGFFKQIAAHSRTARGAKKNGRRKKKGSSDKRDKTDDFSLESPAQRYTVRHCQRRTLYVSFKDLGWQDWIIAPDGYAAYYCEGECSFPLNAHMNATNHAIVQTLVHLMNPLKIPKPCCAPTKLSAISVLYFDDDSNVILKKYRNMMVRSCGCH